MKLLKFQCFHWVFFLVFAGILSVFFKFELNWDFANYHYYNPWAWINGRVNYDVAVAGFNGFFNPLIDVPLFYMISWFNAYPSLIYFYTGLWSGALAFVFYQLSLLFFDTKTLYGKWATGLSLVVAMTGYAVFFQLGTSTNEVFIAFLLMLALYLLINEIFVTGRERKSIILVAGFVAGAAMGLKLTAVIYCVAMGMSLILFFRRMKNPITTIAFFAAGGFFGFLAFDGFWLWKMWQIFQNPFFPFASPMFPSEYLAGGDYFDGRFIPDNLLRRLFLPFYWIFDTHRDEGNLTVVDFRIALAYVFLVVWGIYCWRKKVGNLISAPAWFLCSFAIISYVIWVNFFAIVRYLIPVELLASLLIVKTMYNFIPQDKKWKDWYWQLCSAIFFILMLTPIYSLSWGCRDCFLDNREFNHFVEVKGVQIPDNTLLMFYNYPTAALLPYFSQYAKGLRGVNIRQKNYLAIGDNNDFFERNQNWGALKKEVLENHKGPKIAIVAVETSERVAIIKDEEPLLKGMKCRKMESNIIPFYEICVPPQLEDEVFKK